MSGSQIAHATGLSTGSITNSLILLELAPASQRKVADGQLPVGEAIRILRQQRRVERRRRGQGRDGTGRLGAIWEADWLTSTHEYADEVAVRCDALGHNLRRRIGRRGAKYRGACGQCWQVVIENHAEAKILQRCADDVYAQDPALAGKWRTEARSS
jgi:hypothetical protein